MKNIGLFFLVSLFFLTHSPTADAMLLGDTIALQHAIGSSSDFVPYPDTTRVVQSGAGDMWIFPSIYGASYAVNPENTSVSVYFSEGTFYGDPTSPDPFNGHVISNIDSRIYGVTVDTNLNIWNRDAQNGLVWDDSRLGYNTNSVRFNWAGLHVTQETYFTAKIDFVENPAAMPLPGSIPESSTLLLLGGGVVGAFWMKKRR